MVVRGDRALDGMGIGWMWRLVGWAGRPSDGPHGNGGRAFAPCRHGGEDRETSIREHTVPNHARRNRPGKGFGFPPSRIQRPKRGLLLPVLPAEVGRADGCRESGKARPCQTHQRSLAKGSSAARGRHAWIDVVGRTETGRFVSPLTPNETKFRSRRGCCPPPAETDERGRMLRLFGEHRAQ